MFVIPDIKVSAQTYPAQETDLYGFRILVSDYTAIVNDFVAYYRGFARISHVQFTRYGQYDRTAGEDIKFGLLLNNVGAYNASRPNYLRHSAFHHGLGIAVGVFDSSGIPVENNIVHKSIEYGIRVTGADNAIRRNLLAWNVWGCNFYKNQAASDLYGYYGAIDASEADSAIVEDNFVAGAERIGINVRGDLCAGDKLPGKHCFFC